jgi:succinate dehydrogenase hydrophobic anchor subunit
MISSGPKPREGFALWMIKMVTAVLIIFLLAVHFVMNHLAGSEGLMTYADVVRYYKIPFVPFMEAIFLIAVVTHAFVGLRSILLDLNPGEKTLRWIDRSLVLVASILILYGGTLLVIVASKPIVGGSIP